MRKILLWTASIAMIALPVAGANAAEVEFDWSITSTNSSTELSGSGSLEATETTPTSGIYLVDTISGTADGFAVSLLPVGVGGFEGNDNLIYSPPTTNDVGAPCGTDCQLDHDGLAVSMSNGGEFNIFEVGNPMTSASCDTGGSGTVLQCALLPDVTTFSASLATVSATPLPAALPLFASGLGAMGLFGWRRKRKNASAIAAA
jgi:hypothetical protein